MTATVRADPSTGGPDLTWRDGVLVAPSEPGSPTARALVDAVGRLAGDRLVPVVLDLTDTAVDVPTLLAAVAVELVDRPAEQDVLLLTPGADDPTVHAGTLAGLTGRGVTAANTPVVVHPQGGLVALDDGRFRTSGGGNLGTFGGELGSLYPPPAWAEHVPAQSAFVGATGLLDIVPAGIWIHADPSARSPQQRLGRLVHGVPPVPLWPVVVLGTPGGPALDLDAVAETLGKHPRLLERSVVVPFGVGMRELGALADRLGHGFDAVSAMVVVGETGAAVVRTVGHDGRLGWAPLVSRVRVEPGRGVPEPTVSRTPVRVEDLGDGGDDLRLDAVPAGLWLRTAGSDDLEPDADDPRGADVDPDGLRLFVGDPGRPTRTVLVQRAAALLGRLDPALRQGARIVMVGAAADAVDPGSRPVVPPVADVAPAPPPEPVVEPEPAAPASLVPPTGLPTELDRIRVRAALGVAYGRLGGRTGVVLALEPGRGLSGIAGRDDLVALTAVLKYAETATDTDPTLRTTLRDAFTPGPTASSLLLCAHAGAASLATHRGIAFAALPVATPGATPGATVPEVDDVLDAPAFGRLALTRPAGGDPDTVVLAVRCSTVRRLGGLVDADVGAELLAVPGLRLRVRAVSLTGGTTLVLADELLDEPTADLDWFEDRTSATDDAPELPVWTP